MVRLTLFHFCPFFLCLFCASTVCPFDLTICICTECSLVYVCFLVELAFPFNKKKTPNTTFLFFHVHSRSVLPIQYTATSFTSAT